MKLLKGKIMIKNTILSLIAIITFSACGGGSNGENENGTENPEPPVPGTIIIDGHTLPPMPDETLNNSTLLGIDTNDNGVRDDVEIWIYTTYEDKPAFIKTIAMEKAKAYQIVIQEPEKAIANERFMSAFVECETYMESQYEYVKHKQYPIDPLGNGLKSVELNTEERIRAYLTYDGNLNGTSYHALSLKKRKAKCTFDVDAVLENE